MLTSCAGRLVLRTYNDSNDAALKWMCENEHGNWLRKSLIGRGGCEICTRRRRLPYKQTQLYGLWVVCSAARRFISIFFLVLRQNSRNGQIADECERVWLWSFSILRHMMSKQCHMLMFILMLRLCVSVCMHRMSSETHLNLFETTWLLAESKRLNSEPTAESHFIAKCGK